MAIEPGSNRPFRPEYRMPVPEEITKYCSGLVSLTKRDSKKPELQLAHFSVQEYLRSEAAEKEYFSQQAAAEAIGNLCVSYLLALELPLLLKEIAEQHPFTELSLQPWQGVDNLNSLEDLTKSVSQIRVEYPFAHFAARYWYTYAYILESSHCRVLELVKKYYSNQRAFTLGYLIAAPDVDNRFYREPYSTVSPLYYASCVGLKRSVSMLLRMKADVNAYCGNFSSSLQAASLRGHTAIVRLLIQHGADVNMKGDGEYCNALQAAVAHGNEAIVQMLLQEGADVSVVGPGCVSTLQMAADNGHESIVRRLIQSGADVNQNVLEQGKEMRPWDYQYVNAVQAASFRGYQGIVEILVQKGADLNGKEGEGGSALTIASSGGYLGIVQLLLQRGADITAQGRQYGSALTAASYRGHQDVVNFLLQKGADVNAQGGYQGNALQAALHKGYHDIAKILIQNGADVNAQGGYHGTALKAASYWGSQDIVEILIHKGADVSVQGGEYGTALQAASYGGSQDVVKILIQHDADVNAQGGYYGTALQAASYGGFQDVVKILIQHGADVNVHGGCFGTALQAASHRKPPYSIKGYTSDELVAREAVRRSIVEYLIQHRANVNAQCGCHGNALRAAREANFQSIIDILIKNGAVADTEDEADIEEEEESIEDQDAE